MAREGHPGHFRPGRRPPIPQRVPLVFTPRPTERDRLPVLHRDPSDRGSPTTASTGPPRDVRRATCTASGGAHRRRAALITANFTIVDLIEPGASRSSEPAGLYPQFPTIDTDGSVALHRGEIVHRVFDGDSMKVDVEWKAPKKGSAEVFGSGDLDVQVAVTSERVIFRIPKWRKGLGRLERMTAAMDKEMKGASLAGHIPLDSLLVVEAGRTAVGSGIALRTAILDTRVVAVYDVGFAVPKRDMEAAFNLLVRCSKAVWSDYDLPAHIRAEVEAAAPTSGEDKMWGGMLKIQGHRFVPGLFRYIGSTTACAVGSARERLGKEDVPLIRSGAPPPPPGPADPGAAHPPLPPSDE